MKNVTPHSTILLLAILVLVLLPVAQGDTQVACKATPESVGLSTQRLERLSDLLQHYVDHDRLAGAVTLVARKGHVAYLEAFGWQDIDESRPMTTDSIFRIASQTKAIVSVGVMMLQEEGKLLIQEPVGRYLPEYLETKVAVSNDSGGYDVVPASRPITIRDLLTHTSGVGYGMEGVADDRWHEAGIQGWYLADLEDPVRKTVENMAALPFDAQPGQAFVYGFSTDILGALIEVVSGVPLDRFLQERILDPLGMRDTHFFLPADKVDRLATVYSAVDGGGLVEAPDPGGMEGQGSYVDGPRKCFSGGAGLLSTAGDYARFLQMLLNGGELDGKRLLSRKTVELMTVDHLGDIEFPWDQGVRFGLGFYTVEDLGEYGVPGTVGEYGWGGAYHTTYWIDPMEELIVVYLTQLIPALDLDDQDKVRTLVYQAIID